MRDGVQSDSHDWVIESIADLRDYARAYDLKALAEQLEIALHVALVEIAQEGGPPQDS